MVRDLVVSPLAQAIVAWHVILGVIALMTEARVLIEVLNGLVFAIACGVIVAYIPTVSAAVRLRRPGGSDILVVGIWLAWISLVEARIWSIVWRSLGSPRWLVNTDFTTHIIALAALAGIFHLAGPEAIDGRVPTRQWIRIGIIVALGAALSIGLIMTVGETGGLLRRGG